MTLSTRSPAVYVRGLRKTYGDQTVLDGIDLDVPAGTVFALLGPNGAGKTTTVHVLSTLIAPDSGEVVVAGHDLRKDPNGIRRAIGVTGQFSAVDKLLTVEENLRLMADLHRLGRAEGGQRIASLLARFELADAARKTAQSCSGGMRRKLDLAMTLVGEPSVVFLDEPTTGLDPRARKVLWDTVSELVADGITIVLTTQYLDEADALADTVAVIDEGRVVAQGTPAELKRRVHGGNVRLHLADKRAFDAAAQAFPNGTAGVDDAVLTIPGATDVAGLRAVLDHLDALGVEPDHLEVTAPNLDDVFFALTDSTTRKVAP
ncbi:ATP-binding cassette domain-containing protein [Rhodococcus sp. Eu-32]|uniref:ABC transporter ATP-binding protein n=1 Tax=Rhodococcus sp. Eu-32 TaxID=1017319 RepID=UPI000DF2C769|nr:ATP-binding cassette domain-containing protein [Rhodococcus sp. Eu-32]RRQ28354.1 ATP-binding cassette domain-containing protein [Rhodococcus sp. Eu-32]